MARGDLVTMNEYESSPILLWGNDKTVLLLAYLD